MGSTLRLRHRSPFSVQLIIRLLAYFCLSYKFISLFFSFSLFLPSQFPTYMPLNSFFFFCFFWFALCCYMLLHSELSYLNLLSLPSLLLELMPLPPLPVSGFSVQSTNLPRISPNIAMAMATATYTIGNCCWLASWGGL